MAYAYGNGMYGCLYDSTSGPYETIAQAAESAAEMLELDPSEAETLQNAGFLYPDRNRAAEIGAQVIEIFEVSDDWEAPL